MKDIAQKIRELREDNDILQSSIAQMLNCTRSTISNYENGRNLPSDVIIAYCKYFNVSADWLLGLSTDRRPGGTPLTRKLEELATLVASAGGEPLTADQLADLLDDFIKYYRHGAPAGNAPTTVLTGFLSAMRGAVQAADVGGTVRVVTAVNAVTAAGLAATDILTGYATRAEDPPKRPRVYRRISRPSAGHAK